VPDEHLAGPPVPISVTAPQPPPAVTQSGLVIQDVVADEVRPLGPVGTLVAADIEERKAQGLAKYGTLLRPFNGRDAVVDLYQELLDACQYARQVIAEEMVTGSAAPVSGLYGQLVMMAVQVRAMLVERDEDA
jgi:hypothetical protein